MDFGWAINALKAGNKVTRKGWKQFLWLKPAVNVEASWCKDPVLKDLAERNCGSIPATDTICACFRDGDGKWFIQTGWEPKPWDMFASDWEEYKMDDEGVDRLRKVGEDIERQRKAEAILDDVKRKEAFLDDLDKAAIDRLPKLGSMENCKILSDAINNVLDVIGVMPHLTVTLVPGEDKELLISIEERGEHGAANYPLYAADVDGIIKTNIGSPVKSTRSVAGGYEVEDMKSSLSKEG